MILGRLAAAAVSLTLVGFGLRVALTAPLLSGGHFAGSALILLGGLALVQMVRVARRDAAAYDQVLTYQGERIGK